MALTNYKEQELLAQQIEQPQSQNPYAGMKGVSQNTANNLGNYQAGYKQSDTVTAAQQNLQNIQAQKPQGYTSKYAGALDSLLEQIRNPQEFRYEFNNDNGFKAYADLYHQLGKQASADAMGQAAALTGGYGNSYGQQVGQQTYQQYMLPLYEKGAELKNQAYTQYRDRQQDLKDQYAMLQGADESDYGRYRDVVSDWQRDEALAAERAARAEEQDYGRYKDALDYYTGLAQIENAAWNTEEERAEAIRQFNEDFAEKVRQADLDEQYRRDTFNYQKEADEKQYAKDYAMAILANGQMPSADLLRQAGLSEADARALMAQVIEASSGGGGGGGRSSNTGTARYNRDAFGNYYYVNSMGQMVYVDKKNIPSGAIIDEDLYNGTQNLKKTALNVNETVKAATNTAKETVKNAATSTTDWLKNFFGLK